MIPLTRLARREAWARYILAEHAERHPYLHARLQKAAEMRGTTLLARIRERRAELQRERGL